MLDSPPLGDFSSIIVFIAIPYLDVRGVSLKTPRWGLLQKPNVFSRFRSIPRLPPDSSPRISRAVNIAAIRALAFFSDSTTILAHEHYFSRLWTRHYGPTKLRPRQHTKSKDTGRSQSPGAVSNRSNSSYWTRTRQDGEPVIHHVLSIHIWAPSSPSRSP